ncbi:hypothetical protein FB107DRAFT_273519 [Schizophyllum commune]
MKSTTDQVLERAASVANLAMLRANDLPNHMQIEAINELTSILNSELALLPSDDASETRERILAQLALHRSILAPIRRLPKELLIDIFFRVASETPPLRILYVAVTLARVCAVWRSVVQGLSKLWMRLDVKSLSDFDQYCELFLSIPTKPNLPGLRCDDTELLGLLWDRIEPYASCWRSITLQGRLSILPDLKVINMENLERLIVDAFDAPSSPDLSVLDFVVAPRLQHIALTLDALDSARQLHIPATRILVSLEITTMSPFPITHTFPLLRECADTLQSLIITIRHPLESPCPTTSSDIFVMKALTLLSLVYPAFALLDHISAPSIDELVLGNVPADGSRSLLEFITRGQTSQSLQTLRVYGVEERDASAWMPCLRLLENLKNLYFDELLSNEWFLEQLVLRADRPPLLPSLCNIAACGVFRTHRELHAILRKMCVSRMKRFVVNGAIEWEHMGWIDEEPTRSQ